MNDKLKLDFTLPDQAQQRTMLYIFGGREALARYRNSKDGWEIKVQPCSQCGRCCRTANEDWIFYDPEKGCRYLELEPGQTDKYICTCPDVPLSCVRGNGENIEGCSERWEKVG